MLFLGIRKFSSVQVKFGALNCLCKFHVNSSLIVPLCFLAKFTWFLTFFFNCAWFWYMFERVWDVNSGLISWFCYMFDWVLRVNFVRMISSVQI